jgi:pimeloyl-ACP methyl ester carboxylesterase
VNTTLFSPVIPPAFAPLPARSFLSASFLAGLLALCAACSYNPSFSPAEVSSIVTVAETRSTIALSPLSGAYSTTGLLFYPGGLVDNHVYDKMLARFAREGFLVVVVKMPANLAVFDIGAAFTVMPSFPSIKRWVIAGHSLGGSMAASATRQRPAAFAGLIFMDSYPADGDSLAAWPGVVLSLFSSVEKVNDSARMAKTLALIPPATWVSSGSRAYPAATSNYSVLHVIPGGSHSRFGSYGPQDGDFTPTISEADFHAEVVDYLLEFFTRNGWR